MTRRCHRQSGRKNDIGRVSAAEKTNEADRRKKCDSASAAATLGLHGVHSLPRRRIRHPWTRPTTTKNVMPTISHGSIGPIIA